MNLLQHTALVNFVCQVGLAGNVINVLVFVEVVKVGRFGFGCIGYEL
jgi:hypothetical protein